MILVTGGAGYIGAVVVHQLLERGEAVRIFDKLFFTEAPLKGVRDKIELVQGDIRTIDPSVLEGVTAIIHAAGLSNDPTAEYNPQANHEMNTVATERLAKLAKSMGIKRFIFASSCSIYDKGFNAEDILQDETAVLKPRAAYSVSKYQAEQILLKMADEHFKPVIFRQGTVYGYSPRMRYDLVVNTFVRDALTKGRLTVNAGGEMWRPLIDVTDIGLAYLTALTVPVDKIGGQIFNLSYKNYRVLELAHWVREALKDEAHIDIDVDYTNYNTRSYRVSTTKTERLLGFRPKVSVKDSVLYMIEKIREEKKTDFENPIYYNIKWMTFLDETERLLKKIGSVYDLPEADKATLGAKLAIKEPVTK
ncbi:SDR family oxidoreductase [Candidatus Berkelbacteria bacterium]|nr:SDR family oxidoreductase [Candidatus Berkelbacteria bacterium]